jgi:hypothetical protein
MDQKPFPGDSVIPVKKHRAETRASHAGFFRHFFKKFIFRTHCIRVLLRAAINGEKSGRER